MRNFRCGDYIYSANWIFSLSLQGYIKQKDAAFHTPRLFALLYVRRSLTAFLFAQNQTKQGCADNRTAASGDDVGHRIDKTAALRRETEQHVTGKLPDFPYARRRNGKKETAQKRQAQGNIDALYKKSRQQIMRKQYKQNAACTVQNQVVYRDNIIKVEACAEILREESENKDAEIVDRVKPAQKNEICHKRADAENRGADGDLLNRQSIDYSGQNIHQK